MRAESRSTVGVRELKSALSAYLRRVRRGESIVVTDRGTAIARIVPAGVPDGLLRMMQRGEVTWSGRKPRIEAPRARTRGHETVADIIIEDRESRAAELLRAISPPKSRRR